MSRIGRLPIALPAGVTVSVENDTVTVNGSKGSLSARLISGLNVQVADNFATVSKTIDNEETQKMFGLMRTLLANMVKGVSSGFERQLEINGVGFRAAVSGNVVNLNLGFSHPIAFKLPTGIEAKVDRNLVTISGFDKQLVGQVAADIRELKKPEPYKGKGIKYVEERIRRKAGKTATKG